MKGYYEFNVFTMAKNKEQYKKFLLKLLVSSTLAKFLGYYTS